MSVLFVLVAAYLFGSIPFALVSSRIFGLQDPRSYGSGNPGATNVLRSGHKAAAALTLAGDCLKGGLAVWAAGLLGFTPIEAALAGFAAFLGHVFTVFLRFNGGKGVATALGVLAGIDWRIALASLLAWIVVAFVSRYSSAASLAAAALSPIVGYLLLGRDPVIAVLLAMSAVLMWRHKGNIQRLLAGTEGKLGSKKS